MIVGGCLKIKMQGKRKRKKKAAGALYQRMNIRYIVIQDNDGNHALRKEGYQASICVFAMAILETLVFI